MDELNFRVSAELKNILGRDLITNSNIAILELVKNCYDARATKVEITFKEDAIIIADNGKGMTRDDIIDKWLFIAYSAKRDGTEDPVSYRNQIRRHYAGAKGIGRMSCDRLARFLKMTTKKLDSSTVEVIEIDWTNFESKQDKEFDTISVKHASVVEQYAFPEWSNTGTELALSGLHDEWGRESILSLRKSLEKMINPFSGLDDFSIEIKAPTLLDEDNDLIAKIEEKKQVADALSEKEQLQLATWENSVVNGLIQNTIADVLKIKTTRIDSRLENGIIKTTLTDRGEVMYELEEPNCFAALEDVSINLYFLNRAAKFNFSLKMGVTPVSYGNVFLFRNGFRILPYGESDDDSWGLNRRAQQGYNRYLGTRDLFGRVDVVTENVERFKEVSSRDGGLIDNDTTRQLHEYFNVIHRRLERYVVGVLWGESFVRNDYFLNKELALEARTQIQEKDKDADSVEQVYESIGSKVDFVQLIKSLVNDNSVCVKFYNTELADIVKDFSVTKMLQISMIEDLKKIAIKTQDSKLMSEINVFEKQIDEIRKEKEQAEIRAEEEHRRAEKALWMAETAESKRKEEEGRRIEKEKELSAEKQSNLYLSATRNTSQEVADLIHAIELSSNDLNALITTLSYGLRDQSLSLADALERLDEMAFHTSRIIKISNMLTKADINLLSKKNEIDIQEYVKEYIQNFTPSIRIVFGKAYEGMKEKRISALNLAVVVDNLVSNSKKALATEIRIDFSINGRRVEMLFSDNGTGVDLEQYTAESIFSPGVTNRRGGSGIGLSTIKNRMDKDLNGQIEFLGNGLYYSTGATFKLIFN